MQNQNKTMQELLSERASIMKAAQLPGVPAAERLIYANTIIAIDRAIEAMQSRQDAPQEPAQPIEATTVAAPPQRTAATQRQAAPATKPSTPPPPRRQQIEDADCIPIVEVELSGRTRLVKIEWGHGKADLLTEGECRSRFTSCLRDLAESRMAAAARWADVERYTSFQRAVAYYQAMTVFWGGLPPTAIQLAIAPLGRVRAEIFSRIQVAAGANG